MKIGGTFISSLDYPGRISLVISTGGCPLKCPYCHNPELIDGGDEVSLISIFKKIDDATEFVDSVALTGGEPILQFNAVKEILAYAKSRGLETKLDTNGIYPEKLSEILYLADYVSLDIKCPFDKYSEIIGADIGKKVKKSMEIISSYPETFLECRTTYVPGLMKPEDIKQISREIKCDVYTLQQFRNRKVLDSSLDKIPSPSPHELKKIGEMIKPILNKVKIKTAEFGEEII